MEKIDLFSKIDLVSLIVIYQRQGMAIEMLKQLRFDIEGHNQFGSKLDLVNAEAKLEVAIEYLEL